MCLCKLFDTALTGSQRLKVSAAGFITPLDKLTFVVNLSTVVSTYSYESLGQEKLTRLGRRHSLMFVGWIEDLALASRPWQAHPES